MPADALHYPDASFEELVARCNPLLEDPADRNLAAGWALADAEDRGCFEELRQAVGGTPGALSKSYARTLARVARLVTPETRDETRDLSWSHYVTAVQRSDAGKPPLLVGRSVVRSLLRAAYDDRAAPLSTRAFREAVDREMGREPDAPAAEASEGPRCPKCGAEL